jgi:hypothetical protein
VSVVIATYREYTEFATDEIANHASCLSLYYCSVQAIFDFQDGGHHHQRLLNMALV